VKLNVWSPLPPSPSGIADYVAEQLPLLARAAELTAVVEHPAAVAPLPGVRLARPCDAPAAALDVYHLGNSPSHAYAYRAAIRRPGVAVLHEWSLHQLVLFETVERGDASAYLRLMRRAYGERGTFLGRQIARALGGELWPALHPLNERVLERSLAAVGLTRFVASRAARALSGRPLLQLPHHVALPLDPVPTRGAARRALGLPADALIVAAPGLAGAHKGLDAAIRAVARVRERHPLVRLVVAGALEPQLPLAAWAREAGVADALVVTGRLSLADFVHQLAAADVVLALRFPSHGEISGALLRSLGVGRPVLVTAGTPAAEEFPEGVVVPVDPGPAEPEHLASVLDRLLGDAALRDAIGRLARGHVARHHALGPSVERFAAFLSEVDRERERLLGAVDEQRLPEEGLAGDLVHEVRRAALDVGLPVLPPDVRRLVLELAGWRR
jgi:glycosyltransferase involved in cell wall biosynthesis